MNTASSKTAAAQPGPLTAAALQRMDFPAVRWAVPGLLPEGLSLLVGKPKIGKSFFALGLGCAVASPAGRVLGSYPVDVGAVLYLALEDNPRRLKRRMQALLGDEPWPAGLHLATDWPRGADAMAGLERWADSAVNPRLILIDTLQKWRPPSLGNRGAYEQDYAALSPLQSFAGVRGLAVVVLHHERKAADDDAFNTISGTHGLLGCADAAFMLKRPRGNPIGVLHITGRDVDEAEIAVEYRDGLWTYKGDAANVLQTAQWKTIGTLAGRLGVVSIGDAAEALGGTRERAKKVLHRMADAGKLRRIEGGKYALSVPTVPSVPAVPAVPSVPAWGDTGDADQ